LEEVNIPEKERAHTDQNLFVLSAENKGSFEKMVQDYIIFLEENPDTDLYDMCYTAAVGRGHYRFRLAIVADSTTCVHDRLQQFNGNSNSNVFFNSVNTVAHAKNSARFGELTQQDIVKITKTTSDFIMTCENKFNEASLQRIAVLYTTGAQIDWKQLFGIGKKISLPTYSFAQEKCWPEFLSWQDSIHCF